MNSNSNPLREKSKLLGIARIRYGVALRKRTNEFDVSRQLIRSGTAPGALICEGREAESKRDLIHKFRLALKEARETEYWLDIIEASDLDVCTERSEVAALNNEVIAMLTASLKTLSSQL